MGVDYWGESEGEFDVQDSGRERGGVQVLRAGESVSEPEGGIL